LTLTNDKQTRGKGVKPAMLHVNVRLPQYVLDYFKEFPSYTKEMRRVLEEHVNKADKEGATQVALDQPRWQDILADDENWPDDGNIVGLKENDDEETKGWWVLSYSSRGTQARPDNEQKQIHILQARMATS